MSQKIKAVVFDMDGLMFNTEDLYNIVGESLLQRRGKTFTLELKRAMMGLPGKEAFEVMRSQCGLSESVQALMRETDELFVDLLPAEIEKMPGLDRLLELLEQKGLPKAVATSSHRKFAKRALGFFDLEPRFEFVLTGDDVERGKPNPDVYLMAARNLELEPQDLLVLEDSHIGSRAAKAAGAFTIAVPTVHSSHCDFSHVDLIAKSLEDEVITNLLA